MPVYFFFLYRCGLISFVLFYKNMSSVCTRDGCLKRHSTSDIANVTAMSADSISPVWHKRRNKKWKRKEKNISCLHQFPYFLPILPNFLFCQTKYTNINLCISSYTGLFRHLFQQVLAESVKILFNFLPILYEFKSFRDPMQPLGI